MEVFYCGVAVALIALILAFLYKTKSKGKASVKIANTELLLMDKYYKKQLTKYYILRVMLVLSVVGMILLTALLMARPYYIKKIKEQKYNRDIILCLDISSSVDELNMKLVRELQDTVRGLSGERIGIVIFNTTPVVLSPLTDNYEYTIEQLENIYTALKSQNSKLSFNNSNNWLYWNEYLYGGTLVGNEIRGSSLIGDGLLGGLFAFPETESNRTKVIIFSTDNDPNGDGYVTLKEAADYCTLNDVTVYGIGTKRMYGDDREEMEAAVVSTGGKFFLEEDSTDFYEIVEEIEAMSADLTEGKTIYKMIESPEKFFGWLIFCFILYFVTSLFLRRANVLWSASCVAMAILLVLTYIYAVIPAKQFSRGPDMQMKKKSNLNVLFVVDDTISMLADDTSEGERLSKVKEDINAIVDELDGAQFSIISFNNDAMLLAPFSQDITHVKHAVNSMQPIESYYAKGSSLDTPKELALNLLKSIKSDGKQKTAVFFFSDGEITAENVTLGSYSELAQYVDSGAVLGYGTSDGGTMKITDSYTGETDEIMDYDSYPFGPAISRIDENNLKQIASDINVAYINMTDIGVGSASSVELTTTLKLLKSMSDIKEEVVTSDASDEYINPPVYYGFYALIPFAILVMINAVYVVRRK